MSTTFLIYKHTCTITGKSYIGQTNNLQHRTWCHKQPASPCPAFRNAIQKYGWETFKCDILVANLTLEQANVFEEQLINEHNTVAPNGYNLTNGGLNKVVLLETRMRISATNKRKGIRPPSRLGIPNTAEANVKRAASQKGKPKRGRTTLFDYKKYNKEYGREYYKRRKQLLMQVQ